MFRALLFCLLVFVATTCRADSLKELIAEPQPKSNDCYIDANGKRICPKLAQAAANVVAAVKNDGCHCQTCTCKCRRGLLFRRSR